MNKNTVTLLYAIAYMREPIITRFYTGVTVMIL